jgi:hypothetical protein
MTAQLIHFRPRTKLLQGKYLVVDEEATRQHGPVAAIKFRDVAMPRSPEYEIGKALIAARDRWPRLLGATVADVKDGWLVAGRYHLPRLQAAKPKDVNTGQWMTDDEVFSAVARCPLEEVPFQGQ